MNRQPVRRVLAVLAGVFVIAVLFIVNAHKVQTDMIDAYTEPRLNDVPPAQWTRLGEQSIFFAHMSVGDDLLDGVRAILADRDMPALTITETPGPARLFHARLGHNGRALDKIASFQTQVRALATPPDIAMMKFCYVDFYADTDVAAVFDAYQAMIADLQAALPETTFLHCTVPLTAGPQTPKRRVKELVKSVLGRTVTVDDNAKRAEFSGLLRQAYAPATIIDIARYQSTTPDGRHRFQTRHGVRVPFLIGDYTTDGGHLNDTGRRRVAEQMLIQLAGGGS